MSFAQTERDYPDGKYMHTECKWCGHSFIGQKWQNVCKKCDGHLQKAGAFIKPEEEVYLQSTEQRLIKALRENIDKFDISDDGQIIMKAQPKKSRVTLGAKLFIVAIFACLFASAWIFTEAIYG
nr:hypothetical protein [Providencia rettgeri]